MKRLTGEDQERMMRSRALSLGFDFAQGQISERQSILSPMSHTHTVDQSSRDAIRQPRPSLTQYEYSQVPPISMNMVHRNPSLSTSVAEGSTNASPVSSANEGALYSGNQSPIFGASRNTSPFQPGRGTLQFHNIANQGALPPSQVPLRAEHTGSAANLSPTSTQSMNPLRFGSGRSSLEGLHEFYQKVESPTGGGVGGHVTGEQLGGLSQFQLTPLHRANFRDTDHPNPQEQMRDFSLNMVDRVNFTPDFQNLNPWYMQNSDELPHSGLYLHAEHPRRRQASAMAQVQAQAQAQVQAQAHQDGYQTVPEPNVFSSQYLPEQMSPPYEDAGALGQTPALTHMAFASEASRQSSYQEGPGSAAATAAAVSGSIDISQAEYSTSMMTAYSQAPGYPHFYAAPTGEQ